MKLIQIFNEREKEFTSMGIAVISEAYNMKVTHKKNDEYSFEFAFPKGSKNYKEVREGRYAKVDDTVFIIRTIEEYGEGSSVEVFVRCEHILFELLDEFVPSLTVKSKSPDAILKGILNGTRFNGSSSISKGVNLQVGKGSKLRLIDELCSSVDGIRLVSGMPDELGKFSVEVAQPAHKDKGMLIHNRKNRKSIKRMINGNNVVTRLYAYGADDLTLSTATGGKLYIDSPNISKYLKPREGYITWDDINDPATLLESAKAYLNKIDKPLISYEVEMEVLKKELSTSDVQVGDIITVIDEDLELRIQVAVSELTYYPDLKNKNMTVSLEEVIPTADKLIADLIGKGETDTGVRKGNVWTEFSTIPFDSAPIELMFSVPFLTKPVINVQVVGENQVTPIVTYLSMVDNSNPDVPVVHYTGCQIICEGTGQEICMMAIGRV